MPKKKGPSEHQIQSQILDWLKLKGIFHWRNNTGGFGGSHKGKKWFVRFGSVGSPDIFIIHSTHIIGLEVKGPSGEVSDAQAEFGRRMCRAGGYWHVVRSLDDVIGLF